MHGSKLSLTIWFWAAYLMASHSNGITALQLQKQLGLGSYKSAWFLAVKLRLAMVAPGRSPLKGLVEVDETTFPCRSKEDPITGDGGRSAQGKLLIAGAVEDGRTGRIWLAEIRNSSATTGAASSPTTSPRAPPPRPTVGLSIPAPGTSSMNLMWSAPWPSTSCSPGSITCSPT